MTLLHLLEEFLLNCGMNENQEFLVEMVVNKQPIKDVFDLERLAII